ncbi:MAG TPA: helix-turn-helix domain-containing protein [Xanthobacteraceae bacterium]|jgi:AcrR family transcriptional regulator|nr:helix-turn-helix domain-containing protein [Xanthobacteraceae bacterium]
MPLKSRREEYSEATRRALLRAGRKLFATQGYADTSISEIVRAARLTGGALYHHFRDKKQIFQAIVEEIEQEIMEKADAAAAHRDPWDGLLAGMEAMLDASMAADVQRIGFVDAPVVLGPELAREIEARYGYGKLRKSLERVIEAGLVQRRSVDLLGSILLGCLHESAMAIARADNVAAGRRQASQILRELLGGLRTKA